MKKVFSSLVALSVVACGGGGGSGGSGNAAAPTLNLNEAYANHIKNGDAVLYTLEGDCTGTSSQTSLPAYDTKNYETPALTVAAVEKLQFDSLSDASKASATCSQVFNSNDNQVNRSFYSTNYQTIVNSGGSRFWEVYSEQTALPTTVTAGASGTLYKWNNYQGASSQTGTPVQTGSVTYSVTTDSDSTLLVTFTETGYDVATGKLGWTWATTYRLNANNTLTNLSFAINATPDSPLKAPLKVNGVSTQSITVNAQAAQIASLKKGNNFSYKVYDGNNTLCTPLANINLAALSSNSGTTQNGISYASSNTTSFNQGSFSGSVECSKFNLPVSEVNYFDANYALVQQSSVNTGSTNSNITSSSLPLPTSVKIGSSGQLYTFNRVSNLNQTPYATGNTIYYVGALSPSTLALFEVGTKKYLDDGYVARDIFVSSVGSDNLLTPFYGYINDSGRYIFIPTQVN